MPTDGGDNSPPANPRRLCPTPEQSDYTVLAYPCSKHVHSDGGIMNDAESTERNDNTLTDQTTARRDASALKPKGACWYCNAPLDNIRRFCNKTCAEDYQTEEEVFRPLAP